jgi:hypothetical protein
LGVAVEHDEVVTRAVHFGEFQFHHAIVSDTPAGGPNAALFQRSGTF